MVHDVGSNVVVDVIEDTVVVVTGGKPPSHVRPRASSVPRHLFSEARVGDETCNETRLASELC